MQIKKFSCNTCGAPKINAYKSPYIVCDFCGSFTDIDYTVGLQDWSNDPGRTEKYQKADAQIRRQLEQLSKNKDRKGYFDLQVKYWDLYYRLFPEYLPPTLVFDTEVYKLFIDVCADSSMEAEFDEAQKKEAARQAKLQQNLKYYQAGNKMMVQSESFFTMMNAYIDYLKRSMRVFYENPKYALMHQVLPYEAHLKMKTSMMVQAWLPYLNNRDAEKFLEDTGFRQDYTEELKVPGQRQACEFCSEPIFVAEGAVKVHCEACHRTNAVKRSFHCVSCGTENAIPDIPVHTIDCQSCQAENRLITPLF